MKVFLYLIIGWSFCCGNVSMLLAEQNSNSWNQFVLDIKSKADQGDARAMGILSGFIRNGLFPEVDLEKCEELAKKSELQGSPYGSFALGRLYEQKKSGNYQDIFKKTAPLLAKCAEEGDVYAMTMTGTCFQYGLGFEVNPQEAVRWYQKASDLGYAPAQATLGLCYEKGVGVNTNAQEAVKFYRMAADQGFPISKYMLGLCYEKGIGVDVNKQEAIKLFLEAADNNYPSAEYKLGCLYLNGDDGLAENVKLAYKYINICSKKGGSIADQAQKLLVQNPKLIAEGSEETVREISNLAIDPDSAKYNGPDTYTVVKLCCNGNSDISGDITESLRNNVSLLILKRGAKRIEIQRGEPLQATGGSNIPAGTKLFPVRFIVTTDLGPSRVDVYYYKDPFGTWNSTPAN